MEDAIEKVIEINKGDINGKNIEIIKRYDNDDLVRFARGDQVTF